MYGLNSIVTEPEEPTDDGQYKEIINGNVIIEYPSSDGTATITRHEYVEVIDEETYHFVCEYVSGGYGDIHEDETTYFEFRHALERMKIKTE